jgi:hypothetical protein
MNKEITEQSIELRDYLFKDIKISSSKELKDLYSKLNSIYIQKLRIKYYHVKENKTVVINKAKYVPENISNKTYVMDHITIGLENEKIQIVINIYSDKEVNKFINILVSTIEFLCSIAPFSIKKMKLNYYLIDSKKEIKSSNKYTLTKNEVNSGFCNDGFFESDITIYRIEEVIKVTIHELIHALNFDYRNDSDKIINHYKKRYNINSEKINTYEAYTEFWANILNCYLISKRSKRSNYEVFITLIAIEKSFAILQSDKVFYITNLSSETIDINQKTNVLAYYIIKCELFKKLNSVLKFCNLHNINYVKMDNIENWYMFIKQHLPKVEKNNRRFNNMNKTKNIYKTMRMTINELSIF